MTGVVTAISAAAVVGAGAAVYSADKQSSAENKATAAQQAMYGSQVQREAPFVQSGQNAQNKLNYLEGIGNASDYTGSDTSQGFGSLNQAFNADTFKSLSPAYNFQAQQGAQGTLNQDASSQGALSGAALKDLTSFNQNFANTSFNNAFNQYQTQQTNTFNRLSGIANTGEAAASNAASGGSQYASGIAGTTAAAGAAAGSGAVGASNALTGGATNAAIWAQYGGGGVTNFNNAVGSGMNSSNLYGGGATADLVYP